MKKFGYFDYYGATGSIDKVDDYLFNGEYLMIGEDGGNFFTERDNSFIANGKFWANNHVHVLQPILINIWFLKYCLDTFNLPHMGLITGIAVPKLNQENLNSILIPLPELQYQHKVVEFIKKFDTPLIEYGLLEQQASQLDSNIFVQLKKSMLQYAIQGKLVAQNPSDEPASELLKRIRAEKKAQLGKKYIDSYIYKGDDNCYYEKIGPEVKNITEEIPFEIPENWAWSRLNTFIDFSKNETVKAISIQEDDWVLDLEDIEKDSGKILCKKCMRDVLSKSDKHKFDAGNVLYSKLRPYLNKVIVADENGYCTTEILVFNFGQQILNRYAQIYLMSPFFVGYAMVGAYGVKMPRIGSERGNQAFIPIPPYNEQQRIYKAHNNFLSIIDKGEN